MPQRQRAAVLVGTGVAMLPTGEPDAASALPSVAVSAPVHTTVTVGPIVQGSGYEHPATDTYLLFASAVTAQPEADKLAVCPLASVIVGIASAVIVPVGAYVGAYS
jgi:hypothetical protein